MPARQIIAAAVLGREDTILLLHRPHGAWALPTAAAEPGEWIENALGRAVHATLGAAVRSASFLCLIEHPDGLFVVFDVTTNDDAGVRSTNIHQLHQSWVSLDHVAALDLRPAALRDVLTHRAPPRWVPHHLA